MLSPLNVLHIIYTVVDRLLANLKKYTIEKGHVVILINDILAKITII